MDLHRKMQFIYGGLHMTSYKEILRLHSLGINNTRIAESYGCARSTVISTVQRAQEKGITWEDIRSRGEAEVARKLYPATSVGRQYKMPDYEYIHQEMQKSGVTLSLLWVEYCERCRANGELPYQSTQFNKYYADFVHKTKATLRLEHKPGETMQVDCFCFLCRLHHLSYPSGKLPPSSITTM